MSKLARKFALICFVLSVVVSLAVLAVHRINAGISASVEHKSVKFATATVTSVTEVQGTSSSDASSDTKRYSVCFTLDAFDQVEPEMRQGYQSREAQRLSEDGPRCKVTPHTSAGRLNKGDKVSVFYLLENEYKIDVVRVEALGQDL